MGSVDKKISTRDYKNRMVYECFDNNFTGDCDRPALNLTIITIDDRPRLNKRSRYTPDLLPDTISVASKILLLLWLPLLIHPKYLSYLLMILTIFTPLIRTRLTVAGWKEDTDLGKVMKKYSTKRRGFITPRALIKTRDSITVVFFPGIIQRWGLASCNINIVWPNIQLIDVFAFLISFTLPVEIVFVIIIFLFHW